MAYIMVVQPDRKTFKAQAPSFSYGDSVGNLFPVQTLQSIR